MTFRIAHISDPHLSPEKPAFEGNFHRVAAHLRACAPDLVIDTGDVSLDGADSDTDLAHARRLHDAIGLPWRAVPGNHDVGDDPAYGKKQPADEERHARFVAHMGAPFWTLDVPGWRIAGFDTLALGSSFAATEAQWDMLADAVRGLEGRALALFTHKPLFRDHWDETERTYWHPLPEPRARLRRVLGAVTPALVATGHVHQFRDVVREGMHQVWAPPVSFIVGDDWQETIGTKLVGYVAHALHADGTHESRLVTVDGLALDDIGLMPEVYGPLPRIR